MPRATAREKKKSGFIDVVALACDARIVEELLGKKRIPGDQICTLLKKDIHWDWSNA